MGEYYLCENMNHGSICIMGGGIDTQHTQTQTNTDKHINTEPRPGLKPGRVKNNVLWFLKAENIESMTTTYL